MKKKLFISLIGVLLLTGCGNASTGDEDSISRTSEENSEYDTEDADKGKTGNEEESTNEEQETSETSETDAEQNAKEDMEWTKALMKLAYADVIAQYQYNDWDGLGLANLTDGVNSGSEASIQFGLADVDGNGFDELIVNYDLGYMASMQENIFGYDTDLHKVVRIDNSFFPSTVFYDNGIIIEEASHSQGMAGDSVWPYTLWKYDDEANRFVEAAYVDGWDKAMGETDIYSGEAFPDDVDIDGDGYIYYVSENGVSRTIDNKEYEEWRQNALENANEISVDYTEVSSYTSTARQLCADYERLFMERTAGLEADGTLDLARTYAKIVTFPDDGSVLDYMAALSDVIDLKDTDGNEIFYEAYINDEKCLEFMSEDGGETWYSAPVDGITLMGIKPGDTLEDAVNKLEYYGFYKQDATSDRYISGISYDGLGVGIESENGIVTKLSISWNSNFWG